MPSKSKPRCPLCRRVAAAEFKPFCSQRCKDADLANWLGGVYAVPTPEKPGEKGDGELDEE